MEPQSGAKKQPGPSGNSNSTVETNTRSLSDQSDVAARVTTLDGIRVVGLPEEDELFYKSFTAAQRRRVRLKTDVRLIKPGSDYHRLARFLETRTDKITEWAPGRRREG